ncbi:MAG: polysaccharide deacetylase family protein [Chloroflexota bacterium]
MTTPTILLYHQITSRVDPDDPFCLSVTPENFAAQMSFLAENGYTCVSLTEAVKLRQNGRNPRKTFAITFDDGYLDNFEVAFPIMQQHGFTATIFTITDFVGRTVQWPHQQEVPFMTWDQMQTMTNEGFSFGAHTQSHPNLHEISLADAEYEICMSKQILEQHLERPIEFLAYPGGHQNQVVQELTQSAGFTAGMGVDIGPDSPYNIWRVQINGTDSLTLFRLKLSGYFERLKQFRQSSKVAHAITQTAGSVLNRLR